jgi:hypothetical protein
VKEHTRLGPDTAPAPRADLILAPSQAPLPCNAKWNIALTNGRANSGKQENNRLRHALAERQIIVIVLAILVAKLITSGLSHSAGVLSTFKIFMFEASKILPAF